MQNAPLPFSNTDCIYRTSLVTVEADFIYGVGVSKVNGARKMLLNGTYGVLLLIKHLYIVFFWLWRPWFSISTCCGFREGDWYAHCSVFSYW